MMLAFDADRQTVNVCVGPGGISQLALLNRYLSLTTLLRSLL